MLINRYFLNARENKEFSVIILTNKIHKHLLYKIVRLSNTEV